MSAPQTAQAAIINNLKHKACLKQEIFRETKDYFAAFKQQLAAIAAITAEEMNTLDKSVIVKYEDKGQFEAHLVFGGDTLVFSMHTNVFTFNEQHFIYKDDYVRANPDRAYCGVIQIYNFLSDTFRYQRLHDVGTLIGRIFINHEGNFFVEGERQLGFLFNDFKSLKLDGIYIQKIIETAMLYAIEFDLWAPNFQDIKQITLGQKVQLAGNMMHKTGKRVGF